MHEVIDLYQRGRLAEAATEHGREQLRLELVAAQSSALTPRLDTAAGTNDTIDFNAAQVRPQYLNGVPTGFTGTGDDVPIIPLTALGDGLTWRLLWTVSFRLDGRIETWTAHVDASPSPG